MDSAGFYPRNRKSKVDQLNPFTNRIFQEAVLRGDIAVIAILLKYGIVLRRNERNQYGLTALQQSVLDGNRRLTMRLLENGADLEAKTSNGWSCLHIAAATADVAMVHLLLSHCADVVAFTKNEELPIDVAASLEVKFMLIQQLSKAGFSELAQWYSNKIANREMENSSTMSPNHVLENACQSSSSSDLNMLPYCTHQSSQSISNQSNYNYSKNPESDYSAAPLVKARQRKVSCWSPNECALTEASDYKKSNTVETNRGPPSPSSGTVSHCGECCRVYVPDYDEAVPASSDLIYMSCSSGYLSESNPENRSPSDCTRNFKGSSGTPSSERNSLTLTNSYPDHPSCDVLRPVSSSPVIATSMETSFPETTRTLPRVSKKPSSIGERKLSLSKSSALVRKRSRIELFIDYYKDSIDGQIDDELDGRGLEFIPGSEGDDSTGDEFGDEPLSPDHFPSQPDPSSSTHGLQELQAILRLEGNGAYSPNDGKKISQQESLQILLDAMDREIELPEQNMYFNPMYKSPPESSADSQERLSREGYPSLTSSLLLQHEETAWHSSTASVVSMSTSPSTTEKQGSKRNLLAGIVSRLRDSVKIIKSNSDSELTDKDEPTPSQQAPQVTNEGEQGIVRRSNSFSSYFGSLFDTNQALSSASSKEIRENIEAACDYPEDYYFVDRGGYMMKRCKQTTRPTYKHHNATKSHDCQPFIPEQSDILENPENNIYDSPTDRAECFSSSARETYNIESLVTPRLLRREVLHNADDCLESRSFNGVGYEMIPCDSDTDSWNLYPHTIILNNGSLSPDTDDQEGNLSSNFQCSCRDCVLTVTSLRSGTRLPTTRNTYHRRCQPILAGVPPDQDDSTTCMSFKFLCK